MKFKIIIINIVALILLSGCQTIQNKSDEVAQRENEKFGQFVGKQVIELKTELGSPTDDFINELGNETLIYRTKSNIQSSYSIKEKYEQDYLELRDILKKNNVSIGDYLVNAYQELDKGSPNFQRIKTIRFSR